MEVICRQEHPTEKQNLVLGYDKKCYVGYELTINQEYTVLGLNFQSTSLLNKGVTLLLRDDVGRCGFIPICLLEISSSSPSRFWIARKNNEFDLCLWPEEFFLEYFHDDLSAGVTTAVETFERVYQALNKEADAQASRIQESISEPVSIVKIKWSCLSRPCVRQAFSNPHTRNFFHCSIAHQYFMIESKYFLILR